MNKKLGLFISLLLIMALASCTSKKAECYECYPKTRCCPQTSRNADYASAKLAEAANSISDSLNQLAAIEKANCPRHRMPPPPNPAALCMGDLASVDWSGPVEPLLCKLANASCYKLKVLGRRPAIPALVNISEENQPIADIIRNVSYQIETKADIVIYPSRKIIELRYLDCHC